MSDTRAPLPPINFKALADALLAQVETLVPAWLPGGTRVGREWVCGSLSGGEGKDGPGSGSCSVNLHTGVWSEFASGENGGDLISLYAAINDLKPVRAAVDLARAYGLESVAGVVVHADGKRHQASAAPPLPPPPAPSKMPASEREQWVSVMPVPDTAPQPTFWHYSRAQEDIVHTAEYRCDDRLYGYVVRFQTSGGGKETVPYTYCQSQRDQGCKWSWKFWDEPRPLYLPGGQLPDGRTVVLVEGEVKACVLQDLLDSESPGIYCVASWPGGCNAWKKSDWSWLAGSTVLLWPDCDAKRERLTKDEQALVKDDVEAKRALQEAKPLLPVDKQPGMQAMLGIAQLLRDTHGCKVSMLPIPAPGERPDGWDCKDAIVDDGWTHADVLAFFGRAQPLQQPAGDAPEGDIPQSSGDTGASDAGRSVLGADGKVRCGKRLVPEWLSWYWDEERERWNVSRKLVISALEHDPALMGVLAYCELTNTVRCRVAWPWPHAKAGEIRGADSLLLGKYLTDTYGLPAISKASLEEAIQTVAYTERFHPIREWLLTLKWDGRPRLDKWLVYALGETPESLKDLPGRFEYLSLVGAYWLQGLVWRVMEPGCKFDYCPVLEGDGGLRKSTLVETLVGAEWFSDTPFDMGHGKEAQEQVQGVWGYEIAELSAMSKADVNAIKAFISSKVDRYRVAYGTTVESFPRQCVLTGTTNEDTYLRDRTGNRRFWPVPVRNLINAEWVARMRGQLFAEAFARYLQGQPYTPTSEQETRLFKPMQDSRLIETAVESMLLRLLTREPGEADKARSVNVMTSFVTVAHLVEALGSDVAKTTPGLENQIRGWLKQYHWQRDKKQINGARAWGFVRPAVWPPVDPDDEARKQPADAPISSVPAGDAPPVSMSAQFLADMNDDEWCEA